MQKLLVEINNFIKLKKKGKNLPSQKFLPKEDSDSLYLQWQGIVPLKFGQKNLTVNWLFQEKVPSQKNHEGSHKNFYANSFLKVWSSIKKLISLQLPVEINSFKILPKTSEDILALRPIKVKGLSCDLTVNSEAIYRYYFYWQISDVLLKIKKNHLYNIL